LPINIDILNTLIRNQKDAIRYQILFASIVVLLGACLILISTFSINEIGNNDPLKLILTIGGGFISTISAYPINQIITRKEKLKTYSIFLIKQNEMTEAEIKKIEELIWKSIEKIV
jgi:hypothetical protein